MLVRVERLALRINGLHTGDVEGVHELTVRGEHAFTDGILLLALRDLEGLFKAVDDRQQVFGKLLDAELAGLLNLLGGTAAGVFKLRHGAHIEVVVLHHLGFGEFQSRLKRFDRLLGRFGLLGLFTRTGFLALAAAGLALFGALALAVAAGFFLHFLVLSIFSHMSLRMSVAKTPGNWGGPGVRSAGPIDCFLYGDGASFFKSAHALSVRQIQPAASRLTIEA